MHLNLRIKISWGVLDGSFLIRWTIPYGSYVKLSVKTASWQNLQKSDATVKISIDFQKLFEIPEEMSRKIQPGWKWYLMILTGVVVGKSF